MRRVQSLLVVLLLSFWLGVTIQCGLKAAGLLDNEVACTMGGKSADEGCRVTDHDDYRGANDTLTVAAPQLFADYCHVALKVAATPDEETPHVLGRVAIRPLEWVPARHFVLRAALSPRAPAGFAA